MRERLVPSPAPLLTRRPSLLFGAALVVAPQLLGGAFGWAVCVAAALVGVSLLLMQYELGAPTHIPWIVVVLLLLAFWTSVQMLRLPCDWVSLVSHDSVELTQASARLAGSATTRCTLSYAPAATRSMLLLDLACAAAALVAAELGRQGRNRVVIASLALSAGLMAIVAFAHWALSANAVFGVYTPRVAAPIVMAPLINGNHLAGFLAFGAPFLLHFSRRGLLPALRALAGSAFCLSAVVIGLTGSRSGTIAFVVATALWLGTSYPERRGRSRSPVLVLLGVSASVAAFALCWRASQPIATKIEIIREALLFALRSPLVGVGRGAFSAAFVRDYGAEIRAVHAENLLADYAAQWGLVAFAFAALALAWIFWETVRRTFRAGLSPALIACAVIAVHDLADFSLQMAGVALPAAAALGSATGEFAHAIGNASRRYWIAAVGSLGLLVVLLSASWVRRLDQDSLAAYRERLVRLRNARAADQFHETLQASLRDHPTEPVLALLAAAESVDAARSDAPAWLNRTFELAPQWAGPHIEAARWLLARGQIDQAAIELNEAVTRDFTVAADATCQLARPLRDPRLVLNAAPGGQLRERYLNAAVRCLAHTHPVQIAVDRLVTPTADVEAIVRQGRRLAEQHRDGEAETLLRKALAAQPSDSIFAALGGFLLAQGRQDEALKLIATASSRISTPTRLELRARALARQGKADEMRRTIEQLQRTTPDNPGVAAQWLVLLGEMEEQIGERQRALAAYEKASWLDESLAARKRYARLAWDLGMVSKARSAYEELCAGPPRSETACAKLRELRAAIERPPGLMPLKNRPSQDPHDRASQENHP